MTAAMVIITFVSVALAAAGWMAFWTAQDQNRGLLAERDAAYADVDRLHRILDARLDDTPIAAEAARYLELVDDDPEGGAA